VIGAAILAMWFTPPPQGLTVQAWRLFATFAGAIVSVVANVLRSTASAFAVAAAVLTGLLPPARRMPVCQRRFS
jgi:DASS family divalent anion:Na+ symporter